jgi:hypothetical protein
VVAFLKGHFDELAHQENYSLMGAITSPSEVMQTFEQSLESSLSFSFTTVQQSPVPQPSSSTTIPFGISRTIVITLATSSESSIEPPDDSTNNVLVGGALGGSLCLLIVVTFVVRMIYLRKKYIRDAQRQVITP